MNRRLLLAAAFLAPAWAGLIGCGTPEEKTVPVRGKILKGGLPFTAKEATGGKALPPGDPGIRIKFTRIGGSNAGNEYDGVVDPQSGSFEVHGNAGKGIPASRYKVDVFAGAFGIQPPKSSGGGGASPPGVPPIGGSNTMEMGGKPIHSEEVEIPDAGKLDVVIDMKKK